RRKGTRRARSSTFSALFRRQRIRTGRCGTPVAAPKSKRCLPSFDMSGGISDRAAMAFGRQLSSPSGLGGQLVGLAMRIANRRPTRALIEALDVLPEHFVLDIGCGDGSMLQQIGQVAWRCGMDTSETMLDS